MAARKKSKILTAKIKFILYFSFIFLTVFAVLNFQTLTKGFYFVSIQNPGKIKVEVSRDKIEYFDFIEISSDEGYWLKTDPAVTGYLEAKTFDPSTGEINQFKWVNKDNEILGINGIFYISPGIISQMPAGDYIGQFRPWSSNKNNNTNWSNSIKVKIKNVFPKPAKIVNPEMSVNLKIMSFNIKDTEYNGVNHRKKARILAKYIADNNIDVAGLQETANGSHVTMPDVSAYLYEELNKLNYFMFYRQQKLGRAGNTIFSKHRIIDYKEEDMTISAVRKLQQINIEIEGKEIIIINTHLNAQGPCLSKLLKYISSLNNDKVIFMGDMNQTLNINYSCEQENQSSDQIKDYLLSCRDENGNQICPGSAAGSKNNIIDYIGLKKSSGMKMPYSKIDRSVTFSDHFPVITEISD